MESKSRQHPRNAVDSSWLHSDLRSWARKSRIPMSSRGGPACAGAFCAARQKTSSNRVFSGTLQSSYSLAVDSRSREAAERRLWRRGPRSSRLRPGCENDSDAICSSSHLIVIRICTRAQVSHFGLSGDRISFGFSRLLRSFIFSSQSALNRFRAPFPARHSADERAVNAELTRYAGIDPTQRVNQPVQLCNPGLLRFFFHAPHRSQKIWFFTVPLDASVSARTTGCSRFCLG